LAITNVTKRENSIIIDPKTQIMATAEKKDVPLN
jgi:hypothetical protein